MLDANMAFWSYLGGCHWNGHCTGMETWWYRSQSSFSWLFALNVSGIFSIVPWSLKKLHAKYLWLFYWILLEWNTFPKQILFFLQLIKVQVLKKIIFSRWGIRPIHDNFKVNMNIDVTVAVVMLKQSIGMVTQNYTFTYIYK